MSKIGIGIVTYQRLEYLKRAVAGVRQHTSSEYELLVADDGSTDGTAEWCRVQGIRVISGANGGVCWNKNRALFALQELGCDPILLLEDDCVPVRTGWDWDWRLATAAHGHLAYAHAKLLPWLISGKGTPTDPYVNNKATAQCSSVSSLALAQVGFFDSRFKGYGVGHAEWTTRMKRAGFGFRKAVDAQGRTVKANLYIEGGLQADDAPTFKDKANVAKNEALFDALKQEPVFRHPWQTDEERARFLGELKDAGISGSRYQRLTGDPDEPPLLRLRHQRGYHRAFTRAFGEARSFLHTSGWLSSMAAGVPTEGGEIIPWMNYTMVRLLRDRVQPDWRVFEFGAGYSTLWWSTKVARIRSVEHDAAWSQLITDLCRDHDVRIDVRPADASFSRAIADAEGPFDVIVVDGFDRPACLRRSLPHLAERGVVILDNSDRKEYREAVAEVRAQGFKELQLTGVAPMTYKEETTSILYRADNCFDL